MTKAVCVSVVVYVRVYDRRAVVKAARAKARSDGIPKPGLTIPDYIAAVQYMIDPGEGPAGCEIVQSTVDSVFP